MKDNLVNGLIYFECNKSGHLRSDCPRLKTGGSQNKKENLIRVQGRAFQMTTAKTKGTFLVNFVFHVYSLTLVGYIFLC